MLRLCFATLFLALVSAPVLAGDSDDYEICKYDAESNQQDCVDKKTPAATCTAAYEQAIEACKKQYPGAAAEDDGSIPEGTPESAPEDDGAKD